MGGRTGGTLPCPRHRLRPAPQGRTAVHPTLLSAPRPQAALASFLAHACSCSSDPIPWLPCSNEQVSAALVSGALPVGVPGGHHFRVNVCSSLTCRLRWRVGLALASCVQDTLGGPPEPQGRCILLLGGGLLALGDRRRLTARFGLWVWSRPAVLASIPRAGE